MALLRSISGLRATLGDDLSPVLVARHTQAFAELMPPDLPIVVGRDGRPSGLWMEDVVVGALRACGRTVRILGLAPTPTVQLNVEHGEAAGGIIITASHNPAPWNGLKFVGADGVFLGPGECAALWAAADAVPTGLLTTQQAGTVENTRNVISNHIQRVLELDAVKSIPARKGETVVVDAVNCSGSRIVPKLLERLGYNVVRINCDGSGIFPHPPEPIPENLGQLCQAVLANSAAFGVAVDPDADRLVLVDHQGLPIGEEYTISLSVLRVLEHANGQSAESTAQHQTLSVCVNYSTTRMVNDVAAMHNATVYRSAVGEINVVHRMHEHSCIIGGEGSGGVIYPACHSGRDAMVGLALIVSLLRSHAWSLRDACNSLPSYAMLKTKVERDPSLAIGDFLERCAAAYPDAIVSREDGVHLSWTDRWVHIRTSNTEPIFRIIAEAPTAADAQILIDTMTALMAVA